MSLENSLVVTLLCEKNIPRQVSDEFLGTYVRVGDEVLKIESLRFDYKRFTSRYILGEVGRGNSLVCALVPRSVSLREGFISSEEVFAGYIIVRRKNVYNRNTL